jgi:hypothetical protein
MHDLYYMAYALLVFTVPLETAANTVKRAVQAVDVAVKRAVNRGQRIQVSEQDSESGRNADGAVKRTKGSAEGGECEQVNGTSREYNTE